MEIVIYSRPNCKYCDMAKALLELRGFPCEELDAKESTFFMSQGFRTVPQIYIDNKHIGGYHELLKEINNLEKE